MNALDLIDSPAVSTKSTSLAAIMLEQNYGVEYSGAKMKQLFDQIREDGWSEERFQRTFTWFLRNKPYAAWTIADWFSFGVKVYPYEWTLDHPDHDSYELPDGTVVYKPKDGQNLPWPEARLLCVSCEKKFTRSSGHKFNFCVPQEDPDA